MCYFATFSLELWHINKVKLSGAQPGHCSTVSIMYIISNFVFYIMQSIISISVYFYFFFLLFNFLPISSLFCIVYCCNFFLAESLVVMDIIDKICWHHGIVCFQFVSLKTLILIFIYFWKSKLFCGWRWYLFYFYF